MKARERLYDIENITMSKSVNIDDSLYEKIKILKQKKYKAEISDIVNIAIEEYIAKNSPVYYGKLENETVTYRNLMLRKTNIEGLNVFNKNTGISFTRLVNGAIKEFLDDFKQELK